VHPRENPDYAYVCWWKIRPPIRNDQDSWMEQDQDQVGSYTVAIDREFVTSAKKIANFNEFSEIKKIRTKICYVPE